MTITQSAHTKFVGILLVKIFDDEIRPSKDYVDVVNDGYYVAYKSMYLIYVH